MVDNITVFFHAHYTFASFHVNNNYLFPQEFIFAKQKLKAYDRIKY
jgi:hypothetical protein